MLHTPCKPALVQCNEEVMPLCAASGTALRTDVADWFNPDKKPKQWELVLDAETLTPFLIPLFTTYAPHEEASTYERTKSKFVIAVPQKEK